MLVRQHTREDKDEQYVEEEEPTENNDGSYFGKMTVPQV
jgi:hypothetical protein